MPDNFDQSLRSRVMARVSGKDTKPEMIVRRLVHRMGYRYRLHARSLPGRPDLVLAKHRKVIFVHGCFWHGHEGCRRATRPTSNVKFWDHKLDANILRDATVRQALEQQGWEVLTVWECQTKNVEALRATLSDFLKGREQSDAEC